jgi:hypothetical protein
VTTTTLLASVRIAGEYSRCHVDEKLIGGVR